MADIHVLAGADAGGSLGVAFHFPVPDTDNAVGVNYRTALITSGKGGTTSLPDGDGTDGTISAAEKASIEAGAVYEHTRTITYSGIMSGGDLLTEVRSFYARDKADLTARIATGLNYFGYTAAEA